jgi:hypothetical protein
VGKDQVQNMGTPEDMAIRDDTPRNNDTTNKRLIAEAKKAVKSGLSVVGDVVCGPLDCRSLLPLEVSPRFLSLSYY